MLAESAIDPEQAAALGVREALTVEDLPERARSYGEAILPAVEFPWRTLRGEVVEQVRPLARA